MRWFALGLGSLVLSLVVACGGSSPGNGGNVSTTSTPDGGSYVITISSNAYSPADLAVPPGATVTVVNKDATPHSVTSETANNQFVHGAVNGISFDTGAFMGQKTFTIPASAAAGTVVPFFCTVHLSAMVPPNGAITINPSAQPNSSGGGTTSSPTPTPVPTPAPAMPGMPGSGY